MTNRRQRPDPIATDGSPGHWPGTAGAGSPGGERARGVDPAEAELRVAFRDVVRTIALALEMDERGKLNHGVRVAVLAHRFGDALGLPDAGNLYYAGLLHDLGAMGVSDQVVHALLHGENLPDIRRHGELGAQIVRPLAALRSFEDVLRDHHERHDGGGFPHGKRGSQIALGASVVRLADQIELALRARTAESRVARVERTLARERAGGVPMHVADAAAEVLSSEPGLIELLCDDDALEGTLADFCPAPTGLRAMSRKDLLSQLLWVLARVVDAKHSYTMGHSSRVAYFGYRIAQALADEVNAWDVAWAGLLHDVGKVGIPRRLLDKPGPLEADELRSVQRHAADSRRIVSTIRDLAHLALPVGAHHERYDGHGYPGALAGEAIPFIGRILAYADVYDALTTTRSYRGAMPHAEALSCMRSMVGALLDPNLAAAAFDALQRWGRSDPAADLADLAFSRFFRSDDADLDEAFGRDAGSGTTMRAPASKRGALLLALEPWSLLEITPALTVEGPPGALAELTGATSNRLADVFEPESARALVELMSRLRSSETHTQYVYTSGGRPLEVIVQRSGPGVKLLCQAATRRLQTMERLALFHRNFLSSAEAMVFADLGGNIVDVNDRLVELFGYAREELVGKHTSLLASGRQDKSFYEHMWAAISDPSRGSWQGELVDRRRDGQEVDIHLSIVAVRDAMGTSIGYVGHLTDVTARKRAENEVRLRRAELLRANEELQRVSRFKDEVIAMTSHDLRGPLGAIANLSALVRDNLARLPQGKVAAHLDCIRDTATRLTELVSDLLDLDKAESGQLVLRPCRVRLDVLLEQCIERVRATTTKAVSIELSVAGGPLELLADAVRAEQVFANLLANAVKFSPERGRVSIHAGYDGQRGRCWVHLEDRGPGIPEEALESVFDRYYQVDRQSASSARGPGSGLGLHIVRSLVALHGGSVRAENRSGGGCRFVVELPADRADPTLAQPVVVLLARPSPQVEGLVQTLRSIQAHVLRVQDGERVRAVCGLTGADLVLYEAAAADPVALAFLAERAADGTALPVVVHMADGASGPDAGTSPGRTLVSPILDSELRELQREAALRRSGQEGAS